jgi:ribosomal protein L7/L12
MDKFTAMNLIIAYMMSGKAFDTQAIMAKLVSEDPIMFARLAGLNLVDDTKWESRVIGHMKNGHKVSAFKEIRASKGCGLKEAKDAADFFMAEGPNWDLWDSMSIDSRDIVQELRNYTGNQFL